MQFPSKPALDIVWVLLAAAMVFIMQAGFLCLESGMTRTKNSIHVAIKNVADFCICVVFFWLLSFGLMFGTGGTFFAGASNFIPDATQSTWLAAFFLFQVMFCGTAVTIVSGAVAERIRFINYIFIAIVIAAVIYPLFGHWAWGDNFYLTGKAWLANQGFRDFAGSSVVHSVGGWAALAIVMIIGPRAGRFPKDAPPQKIIGNNLPLSMLGVILLWFGWFGFNAGSTLGVSNQIASILVNTIISASSGLITVLTLGWIRRVRAECEVIANGCLAGLVSITASCNAVSTLSAFIVGAVGGLVMYGSMTLLEKLKLDDVVGAIPVHLSAGIWGTLAVGFFGKLDVLNTGLSRGDQILAQLLGIGVCFVWAFGICYIVFKVINRIKPLRVSAEGEKIGLNISEHGARTDILELFEAMNEQAEHGDLSLRVPVEPFTEVGQIATRYNQVMASLEKSVTRTNMIVSTAKDAIITFFKKNLTIDSVNAAAEVIFNCPAEKMYGQPIVNFVDLPRKPLSHFQSECVGWQLDGTPVPLDVCISEASSAEDSYYGGVFRDISERKESEKKLFYMARHDLMTDLPNRLQFEETLERELAVADRNNSILPLLLIDIDYFKRVNDTLGHQAGDELLKQFAARLRPCLRRGDFIARIGGDEFVVILTNVSDSEEVGFVAKKLQDAFKEEVHISRKSIPVSISIGIAIYPFAAETKEGLIKNADVAMYSAKEKGRSNYQYFSKNLGEAHERCLELETRLQFGLKERAFSLVYHPIMNIKKDCVCGVEALLRWNDEKLGFVAPEIFIPIAEKMGLIIPIGTWVLRTACQQYVAWEKMGIHKGINLCINVSPYQLIQGSFSEILQKILDETGMQAKNLQLELTETAIMTYLKGSEEVLQELKEMGISILVDDFGTGYSSLSHMQNIPVSALKIDQTFIRDIEKNKSNAAIVESIFTLASRLGLSVITEGVETESELRFIDQQHGAYAQGYYFSKPLHPDDIMKLLSKAK